MPKTKTLKLADITADESVQPRAKGTDKKVAAEFALAIKGGAEFPLMVVYEDRDTYWLSEGFTRHAAYTIAGVEKIACEVREGDKRAATLNACGSNLTHGQRRTNADKRRAVEIVLRLCPNYTDRKIADIASVSHTFVAEIRRPALTQSDDEKNTQTDALATVATPEVENTSETQKQDAETGENSESTSEDEKQLTPTVPAVDEGAEFVKTVEMICRDTDQIVKRMKELKASRFAYSIHIDSATSQVEAARKTLWQGRPAHPCPYCSGEGCKTCAQTGRVKKATFDSGKESMEGVK